MNYIKIDKCNMNNGSGLRCVVWLSGCEHHCQGCFNPETWEQKNGDTFSAKEEQAIHIALSQDWCSGVTFTGGDPLYPANRQQVLEYITNLKRQYPNKTIWVYTGYTFEHLLKIGTDLSHIDVLCDGVFIEKEKSPDKHWVGSSNQRVINVPASLAQGKVILYEDNI